MSGPRRIGEILPRVVAELLGCCSSYKRLNEALDKIGSKDFDGLPIEDKLNLAALFQEKLLCSSFEAVYVTMQEVIKTNFENKPPEYFRMVKENTEKINQFIKQNELAYLPRRRE